jgi:hypothetical protein
LYEPWLADHAVTPIAARTITITALTTALVPVECGRGGREPPPCLDRVLISAVGYGFVATSPLAVVPRPGAGGSAIGTGGATLARASANIAGVLSAGPCRLGRWNSAWQVTASMPAGTPADTWRGVHRAPSVSGAGGSSPGPDPPGLCWPGQYPVRAA